MRHNKKPAIHTAKAGTPVVSTLLLSGGLYLTMAGSAHASALASILCFVVNGMLLGDLGRGVATVGVMAVAGGAALGRVSWAAAVTVGIGIGVIFGAPFIVMGFGLSPC